MTTFTVDTTADIVDAGDGVLSLREALALADADTTSPDRIEFAPGVQGGTIILTGGQLTSGSDVTIDGGTGVTIDANQQSRVLLAEDSDPFGFGAAFTSVTLDHLAIIGGHTTDQRGGGILGDVTLINSTVSGNSTAGPEAFGGGIAGTHVTLINSTVSGNSTSGDNATGGGICILTAGLRHPSPGVLTLVNSTVSGNSTSGAHAHGGGIDGGFVNLTNSTVSGNSTSGADANGGGIAVHTDVFVTNGVDVIGSVVATNSIVAGNAAAGLSPDASAIIGASNGHNIFGSDVAGNAPGDLENVAASVLFAGGLADHGGPTETIALRDAAHNPALGRADPAYAPATDQRGVARPQPEGSNPDIGAFELGPPQPPLNLVDGTTGGEILRGSADADLIRGRPGDDHLWGFAGDDELFGGYGNDVLVGGPGLDRMLGGVDADRFVLRQPEAAPPTGPAYDEILDFARAQHDRIDLQPIDARVGPPGDQAFVFVGRQAFAEAGQLRYEATADGDFVVSGSTDRDLDAEFAFIVRTGAERLETGDFLL